MILIAAWKIRAGFVCPSAGAFQTQAMTFARRSCHRPPTPFLSNSDDFLSMGYTSSPKKVRSGYRPKRQLIHTTHFTTVCSSLK